METVQYINTLANWVSLLISAILLIAAILGGNLKEKVYRWFFFIVLFNLLGVCCEIITTSFLRGTPGQNLSVIIQLIEFINYTFGSLVFVAVARYFYEYMSTKTTVSKKFVWIITGFCIANIVLIAVTQYNQTVIRLDEFNNYDVQNNVWITEILPLVSALTLIVIILQNAKYLKRGEWVSLLSYFVLAIICYAIEAAHPGVWVSYCGSSIAIFLLYVNIQVGLKHELREKKAELEDARIAIMISQIQPHFMFNTLSSISAICEENPLAQQCLANFSEYLRGNMDSLTQRAPVPFEKELEHVRQYLWLEQLRFEEKLQVKYDIQAKDFMLPVLTLQPIVENAVRHGISKKVSAGSVQIHTEETEQFYRIVVTDDGIGFVVGAPQRDGRTHTGIDNVRARLAAMCGGRLTVESTPGQGTTVTIDIPK